MWLAVKHAVMAVAAAVGAVFGYLTGSTEMLANVCAFGFMVVCAAVADACTRFLEVDEDEPRTSKKR